MTGNVVAVQNAYKSYGSGKKKVMVLENLDMRVPQGAMWVVSQVAMWVVSQGAIWLVAQSAM